LCWRHWPSTCSNRIRSASWCSITTFRAYRSAGSSRSVVSSTSMDWSKRCGDTGLVSNNQCWIGVNATRPLTGPCSASTGAVPVTFLANDATVGCKNTSRGDKPNPAARAREIT
jgi:hypothetical protein